MPAGFDATFAVLKSVLAQHANRLAVETDTESEYALVTKSPSPFPQHKGQPLHFGSIRIGKAYVSFHLMPIYMSAPLTKNITPALKKHMQGKSCFNFRTVPDPEVLAGLQQLTGASLQDWREKKWA